MSSINVGKLKKMMDPSRNNLPLQFNVNKNKPPMPVTRINSEMKEDDMPSSTTQSMMGNGGSGGGGGSGGDQGGSMMGMCNIGSMMGPIVGNPNMMMMNPMFGNMQASQMQGQMIGPGQMGGPGMMGPLSQNMMGASSHMMGPSPQGMMGPPVPAKEVITLTSCVLYPPPSGAPPRSTRDKPPGCKTIFVGGIPENCTEDLLMEVFENCGPIRRVRTSKKNFSHIRFENMESVEEALYISGYRMKINDSDAKEDTGRLHIDYAEARDDQFEFECLQRAMAREMRHIQKLEEERNRPPSPQPIVIYAEHEANLLVEKMKSDEDFSKASQVLITWLERGECNRRTVNVFYTLMQNVHSHLRRLTNEMLNINVEYEQFKMQHQQKIQGIFGHICQVERVLSSAQKQRNWDHFTKAQRKNILTWQRQAQEFRESRECESSKEDNVGINDDMDLSDDDTDQSSSMTPTSNKKRKAGVFTESASASTMENENLKEENDHLKCQMEAFKNEVDSVRQEGREEAQEKDKQIKALQNALQGMQQQLISQRTSVTTLTQEKEELEKKVKELEEVNGSKENTMDKPSTSQSNKDEVAVTSSGLSLSDKEAKMVGLVSCFLHVHPNGATVDYLWSYLSQLMPVRVREVEDLLEKMPAIFEQKIVGLGATIERKWMFTALKESKST